MQNTKILDIARTDNNVWNEHHVHIYRTFSSHGDSPHPVCTNESHSIRAPWNVPAATVILFMGQFAGLDVAHHLSGMVLRLMDTGILMYLCPCLGSMAGRIFRQWRHMVGKSTSGVRMKHIQWTSPCSGKVQAHIEVTWKRLDGRALVYVQSMAALLPESRPRWAGLHESLLFTTAAS